MSDAIIEIKNLTICYDEEIVLKNINLEINKGEMVAIIGPNGAGKSTLIKAMLDLTKKISGEILIFGQKYKKNRNKIAYVPQRGSVDWDFPVTVYDVVEMGCYGQVGWIKRINEIYKQKVKKAIEEVGMNQFQTRQINQLSGGQQQRIFIARALVQNADIYILDEPFQGVDIKTEKEIIKILKKLQNDGKTIIVVHHDLNTVKEYFKEVIFINKKIIEKGKIEDKFTEENIRKTYNNSDNIIK